MTKKPLTVRGSGATPTVGNSTCYSGSYSTNGCITVITSGSAVTGATIHLYSDYVKGGHAGIDVANGDAFAYDLPGVSYSCSLDFSFPGGGGYVGPPGKGPCLMNVSNTTTGLWTTATPPVGGAEWLKALANKVIGVGPGKSLTNTIANAQAYYAANDVVAACATLGGFIGEVRAQSGKKINPPLAATLIANATSVESFVGCP